jgi:hypothetical protein
MISVADPGRPMSSKLVDYAGPWATSSTVCEYLGITAHQLEQLVERRQILGVRFIDNRRYFPVRQFHEGRILGGLPEVLEVLGAGPFGEMTWATWLAGRADRKMTGWEHLRAGHLEMLLTEARRDVSRWNH